MLVYLYVFLRNVTITLKKRGLSFNPDQNLYTHYITRYFIHSLTHSLSSVSQFTLLPKEKPNFTLRYFTLRIESVSQSLLKHKETNIT
jgi:hypothetical protein